MLCTKDMVNKGPQQNNALAVTGKNMKTDGGTGILNPSDKAAVGQLFDNIEAYGIFPVRHGELES
ncbi:MAG TPA: hypothetical protein VF463_03745 [Sphingobium sp.]